MPVEGKAWGALLYVMLYSALHAALTFAAGALEAGRFRWDGLAVSLTRGAPLVLGYAATASAGVFVALLGPVWLLPAIGAPILALQAAIRGRHSLYEHYYETIGTLTLMLQRAHAYTAQHLERVAALAEETALSLGLSPRRARLVREAALLHDIGKIAVDERILEKPGRLTPEEYEHVKRHADLGAEIVRPVTPLREMVEWIRRHHERPDGRGYPDGLKDREIPIESKIIAVADAFDAMTAVGDSAKRSYRTPKTWFEAVEELRRCAGSQFDPRVVEAFSAALRSKGFLR
jgi:putative nucleotidyltransferase with HDIG domain